MPDIRLPDGSVRQFDAPVTVAAVAAAIGPGLAKAALAGKVDGKLVDTSHVIDRDADVAIVTERDPEGLEIIRHSTAHLLAYAVKELFPDAQVTIGPVIEDGFYYDFSYKRPFTPDDLAAIEKRMAELAKQDEPVVRELMPRDDAVKYFEGLGEHYKAEIIASIPSDEPISLYREGGFTDLCRGPHVPSTGKLKVFKLTKLAGAYWRGDSKNEMLQRIYGTAWAKKEDLDAYLHRIEEAEKRDHRRLGRALDLFHLQDEAPGMVFWHPKGWSIWQEVEQYMRRIYREHGYLEVKTPQVLDRSLWEKSGHWQNYRDNMFTTESEKRDFAIKPMNCPGHIQIFNADLRSYRDLPLRYGEFGACHRNEPSGALHGIMRVRAFTQDDGHIFCEPAQIQPECVDFHRLSLAVYRDFGFEDIVVKLALRPTPRIGSDEQWDSRRGGAARRAARVRRAVAGTAGRRRVLRPEDRVPPQGLDRPQLAGRHDAGRLPIARAPRRRVRGRGQHPQGAGDAASRHRRIDGALHRHPDRAPRRRHAALARPVAGGRPDHHGPGRAVCGGGDRRPAGCRDPRGRRFAERENYL